MKKQYYFYFTKAIYLLLKMKQSTLVRTFSFSNAHTICFYLNNTTPNFLQYC